MKTNSLLTKITCLKNLHQSLMVRSPLRWLRQIVKVSCSQPHSVLVSWCKVIWPDQRFHFAIIHPFIVRNLHLALLCHKQASTVHRNNVNHSLLFFPFAFDVDAPPSRLPYNCIINKWDLEVINWIVNQIKKNTLSHPDIVKKIIQIVLFPCLNSVSYGAPLPIIFLFVFFSGFISMI